MGRWKICIMVLLLCLLGGCSGLNVEDLYCLPEASEDYYDLQEALEGVLSRSYSYQAPSSGARREPVQLVDLDGDGADEAVAFLRSSQDGTVAAFIFARKDGSYTQTAVIECPGSAIGSVEYARMDDSGGQAILITGQVSEAVTQALQVSRYRDGSAETLLTISCGRYSLTDLDGDGAQEILCLADGDTASAEYYALREDTLRQAGKVQLSGALSSILDITQGTLDDGGQGLLITTQGSDSLTTDLLVLEEDTLRSADLESLASTRQLRGTELYPEDADGDGCVELPRALALKTYQQGDEDQWYVGWYGLSSKGDGMLKSAAYYCSQEGWHLELPEEWVDSLAVREDNETMTSCSLHTVTFYRTGTGSTAQVLLTVYALRGTERQAEAEKRELTILYSDTDVILAVELNEAADFWEGTLSMAQVSERFYVEAAQTDE